MAKNTWFDKLISLGIKAELIQSSRVNEDDYEALYKKLKGACRYARRLVIKKAWQLEALTGNVAFYPQIPLDEFDNWGGGLVHYAAWSGNREAIDWVIENEPALLDRLNRAGADIMPYAAMSGSPQQFDDCLKLSVDPSYFHIYDSIFNDPDLLQCIADALETNYTIKTIQSDRPDSPLMGMIPAYVKRNLAIQRVIDTFLPEIQRWHHRIITSDDGRKLADMQKRFSALLEGIVSTTIASTLFQQTLMKTNPAEKMMALADIEISRLRQNRRSDDYWLGVMGTSRDERDPSLDKLNALKTLRGELYNLGPLPSLEKVAGVLISWKQRYSTLIDDRPFANKFFISSPSQTRIAVDKMDKLVAAQPEPFLKSTQSGPTMGFHEDDGL